MRSETAPRFLIVNAWHDDNKGDSAITLGTIQLLRRRWPGCPITVAPLCGGDNAVRHLRAAAPDVIVARPLTPVMPDHVSLAMVAPLLWWALAVIVQAARIAVGRPAPALHRAVAGADVVVLAGGSNLFDTGSGFGLSTVRLLRLLLPGFAAVSARREVWLLGHTLGPFRSRTGAWLAGRLVRRSTRVVLRESSSLDVARRLGARSPVLGSDMALELRPRCSQRVRAVLDRPGLAGRRFAVVTIRCAPYGSTDGDERLRRELVDAMERLVTSHVVDAVAVVTNVLGPSRVEDDRGPSRTLHDGLAARVGRQRVCLVDDDLAPDELAALYGAATLVVGERFHSVLLALAAGTPAYAISYFTNKAEGMMQDLQLGEFHCRLGDVDGADIHMRSVQLATPATRRRVHEAVGGARDALEAVMV